MTRARLVLLGALLGGFALRLYRLGAESLWYDETVSAYLAQETVPDLVAHTARDIHPPGYYLMLHAWQALVHPTPAHGLEFLYAWPSVFWGMLILALIYALGRRLAGERTALLAVILSAAHPYHIWYSQEVRMYTLGAALGLLVLWFGLDWLMGRRTRRALIGYALTAAGGLYVLYYFAFLLIPLNLWILVQAWRMHGGRGRERLLHLASWLGANLLALVLWGPWLPVFLRQAVNPPVPPWRVWPGLGPVLQESLAALWVGQSIPGGPDWRWLWALGSGVFVLGGALFAYTKHLAEDTGYLHYPENSSAEKETRKALSLPIHRRLDLLLIYIFGPLLLILALSLTLTPLYHVRYFFTYAAPAGLLLAMAMRSMPLRAHPAWALIPLFLAAQGWSLAAFWHAPPYRADDHRGATARLAENWRAGDAILVNAGWVYPALEIYWPQEYTGVEDSLPPPLTRQRLLGYTKNGPPDDATGPLRVPLLTTGSVDGPPSLGWGLPESDFYAMPRDAARQALARVIQAHPRLWHYRFYDTVSDPQGILRAWLDAHLTRTLDAPIPGRDFGRLQRYERRPLPCPDAATPVEVAFGASLRLQGLAFHNPPVAGQTLYVTLCWQVEADPPAPLRTSLRLYRPDAPPEEPPEAQQDEDLPLPAQETAFVQPLAVPVPVGLAPGPYRLELVVYRGDTGEPLPPQSPNAVVGQRQPLADLDVALQPAPPTLPAAPQAVFDYLELLEVGIAPGPVHPGGILAVTTAWRPRPSPYRDTYQVVLSLVDGQQRTRFTWRAPLAGERYLSGAWPPSYPVRGRHFIPLPQELEPGSYTLTLGVERTADGLAIPARGGLLPWPKASRIAVGTLEVITR